MLPSVILPCFQSSLRICLPSFSSLFFFTDPAPTEIYTLSLHDALPIWRRLFSAERLSDLAMRRGSFHVKTPRSNSSALLCFVTDPDHREGFRPRPRERSDIVFTS